MILCCRPFHARGGAVTGLVRRAGSAAGPRARAVPVPRARMTQGETKDPCRSRRADPGSARPGFSPAQVQPGPGQSGPRQRGRGFEPRSARLQGTGERCSRDVRAAPAAGCSKERERVSESK